MATNSGITHRASNWRLLLILTIYLLLAVAYSVVTPIGRGADEWAHYWYAQFIAQNGRLPATPAERESAGYKSDWPPLYHFFAAALTAPVETDGPPTFKYRADSVRRQLVPATGPEAIVHTEDELFPWRQEILVWHLGRFLSIAFSTGTLLVTYFIGLEVFSVAQQNTQHATRNTISNLRLSPHIMALTATAALAFNPRFLFTGMLFNYDSLTLLLSALFLLLSLRVARGLHPRWGFWGLGGLAGLALVTKYLTLLLPLVILFVAWVRGVEMQGRRGAGAQEKITHYALRFTFYVLRSAKFWKHLLQSAAAYLIVTGWWFAYLIVTFNEVDEYGLLLGTLAPLIRGDGSDRTVETLFAWLSGGQAPPPAYIEQQSYSAGQVIASFFTTFWGNPIARPYPLTWFIVAMAGMMVLALIGLILHLRFTIYERRMANSQFEILLLTCLLPVPFMLARLFGARDALEAVQGRHILFLAGPAFVTLLVWGLSMVNGQWSFGGFKLRITFYVLVALLLTGSLSQLIFMATTYPPPAPVRTTNFPLSAFRLPPLTFTLPGGAELTGSSLRPASNSLQVDLLWQGGDSFAPEDYQLELALVNQAGETVSGWAGVQTQARYPTRAWEPGDVIQDTGWLPLVGLPAGDYHVQWRLLGGDGPLLEWQPLSEWSLVTGHSSLVAPVAVWRSGQLATQPPIFTERETAQFTIHNSPSTPHNLIGPDGQAYPSANSGFGWANFIIEPHWPAGDYLLDSAGDVVLRVAPSPRNFEVPAEMAVPLEASFESKIKLLGYTLPARRVEPGDGLPITLYWQGLKWLGDEFVIFTRLLDNQGFAWGGYDRLARENYSTLLWAPGEIITDGFAVPVEPDAPAGVYWLSVGWYRQVDGEAKSLEIVNPGTGEPTGETSVMIGPVKVGGPPPGATINQAQLENSVNVSLGEQVELLGYDWQMDEATNSLNLTLFWQALRQPDLDYTTFVHVRDAAGNVIAQKDQPPLNGAYPTGLWEANEIIKDEVTVPLEGVPPGEYQVIVGLYDFVTGERLPVEGAGAGMIMLLPIEISAAQ